MTRTILIPTDFSNNALVATNYALNMAAFLNADVHILHVYTAFTSGFQSEQMNKKDAQRAKEAAENGMKDFLEKLSTDNQTFQSSIMEGNLLQNVKNFVSEKSIDLVIMGTHGASETRRDLLGSNTYDVAKNIEIPLLIVPEHNSGFSLEQIVFFTDYQNNDYKVLESLSNLLGDERKPCTLIHIAEDPVNKHKENMDDWLRDLSHTTGYKEINGHVISKKEQLSVVNDAIKQFKADLCLLTLIERRGFFEKLFRKSLAREIIINPTIPVLLTK